MTLCQFCQAGTAEPLKGSAHRLAWAVLAVLASYNAAAFYYRWDARHACLSLGYGLGCWFEHQQAQRHHARG